MVVDRPVVDRPDRVAQAHRGLGTTISLGEQIPVDRLVVGRQGAQVALEVPVALGVPEALEVPLGVDGVSVLADRPKDRK